MLGISLKDMYKYTEFRPISPCFRKFQEWGMSQWTLPLNAKFRICLLAYSNSIKFANT